MNITDITVFPKTNSDKEDKSLKAYASITLDREFVVKGLKVINGKKGLFVVMPSRKLPDGTFKDIAHPLNTSVRKQIEEMVIAKFQKVNTEIQPKA
jgi:stage V sporulation protein G